MEIKWALISKAINGIGQSTGFILIRANPEIVGSDEISFLLPFFARDIDADGVQRGFHVRLDDRREASKDQPERRNASGHVPEEKYSNINGNKVNR